MKSHELLQEVFAKSNVKQISASLGLSESQVYKWSQAPAADGGSGTSNPLDRVQNLFEETQDLNLIRWICERAGGFFVENPNRSAGKRRALTSETAHLIQEFAGIITLVSQAAEDGKITKDEAKRIRRSWDEIKSRTECFVNSSDAGEFNPSKTFL